MSAEHLERFVRKLESIAPLSPDERRAILSLPVSLVSLRAQQDFVREGDRPMRSALLVEGFAVASKVVGAGKRQITYLYVPGDMPDLQSLHLSVMDFTATSLVPSKLAFIQHDALRQLCADHTPLCFLLWRMTLIDAAVYREWVANTGQRAAISRTAHVLCEVVARLHAVQLAQDYRIDFPMTQAELGDALGLSPVHVNRVLQDLRNRRLIELKGKRLAIPDWPALCKLADFDPGYLHLKADAARWDAGSQRGTPAPARN